MREGKYTTTAAYHAARARRWALRAVIRHLVSWRSMVRPKEGYTVVVACHARLAETMIPGLRLLARQDLTHLDRTWIAFDAARDPVLESLADRVVKEFPQLRIECLYQDRAQAALLRKIEWGWVDCWLSYCKGIARAETRHVMLHDMDAMLLRPGLVEARYRAIRDRGDHFLGCRWYEGNGIREENELCYIVESMLDAAFLRESFRPIDLFNHITTLYGATVDLDTLLYPQLGARRSVMALTEEDWVHPGQVISQYTYLAKERYVPPDTNNLFFIPYFLFLTRERAGILATHTRALRARDPRAIPLVDRTMDMSALTPVHLRWVAKQIVRIERALAGDVRPAVREYLEAIQYKCDGAPLTSFVDEVASELDAEQRIDEDGADDLRSGDQPRRSVEGAAVPSLDQVEEDLASLVRGRAPVMTPSAG
jgi:hypothetical protein